MPHVLESPWSGIADAPFSRAELYDAAAYGVHPRALQWLLENFEILSRPRQRIGTPLRRGDILLRRGDGGLAHACVIVDPEFRSGLEISMQGGRVEFGASGNFVFVAERGSQPHEEHDRFARRVTDEDGRVLGKQIILRPRPGESGDAERIDPMSIMVGMTLAQQMTPQRPVIVNNAAPVAAPAGSLAGGGEWAAPDFESASVESVPQISWHSSCHSHAQHHSDGAGGESAGDASAPGEFASPEHHRLGDSVQVLVDRWAKSGLVSGGCFVIDSDSSGNPLPLARWQYFLPDRANPAQPYGADARHPEHANWHWIVPNALNDAQGHPWTAASLAAAVVNGSALTMSIGDLILTSGDLVGDFREYAAGASRPGWRGTPINLALGVARDDAFALAMVRRLAFPRTGVGAARDLMMVARASSHGREMRSEILASHDHGWLAVRHLINYLNRVRGTASYHQLRILSRLQRRDRQLTIENIERVAPYMPAGSASNLLLEAGLAGTSFGSRTPIDDTVLQTLVTNGAYSDLALNNELHFAPTFFPPSAAHPASQFPGNWHAFEEAHTSALRKIDDLATVSGRSTSAEPGPIPADAIAQLAHGLHFLTDAFSSGHMRVPRHQLGRHGSMLSGVMHDFENTVGLTVTNGFGDRWHAFGDGHLEDSTPFQLTLLAELVSASARSHHPIESSFHANRDHAFSAVAAAFKQLHYQAQKYFGDPAHSTQYQQILGNNRGTATALAHDEISRATPGDGTSRDAWIAMDIPAKIAYLRKHRPEPVRAAPGREWRVAGVANYPPLVSTDPSGHLVTHNHTDYALDQSLLTPTRVLYQMVLTSLPDLRLDISKYVLMAALAPASSESWAGRDTREVFLQRHIESWPDHRGFGGRMTQWIEHMAGLDLP